MENLFNSEATIVYKIINTLGVIAGAGCLAMIVYAFFKIILSEEQETNKYLRRIKNGIIAFVLILSITVITNLVTKYFSPNIDGETSIGEFRKHRYAMNDQGIASDMTDKDNRTMITIDGQVYVETASNKKIDLNAGWGQFNIYGSVYKLYSECQGATGGSLADDQYYIYWEQGDVNKENYDKYKGYLFSAKAKESNDVESNDDFKNFMEVNGVINYQWFTKENNPYRSTN